MRESQPIWNAEPNGPRLTYYPSSSASIRGTVMVLPGGAYAGLADHEGEPIAKALNDAGFHATVLHYRLAPDWVHPAMLHDAQRGMRLTRSRFGDGGYGCAVLGFSAGGHLASSLSVHYDRFSCEEDDLLASVSARPDASVLCYPVIDLLDPANLHTGSRQNLLGPSPSKDQLELMSTQRHVDGQTPPTFLWHTADDQAVPMANSLVFASACRAVRVPVELHVYEHGRHGLGLAESSPDVKGWLELAQRFLAKHLDLG